MAAVNWLKGGNHNSDMEMCEKRAGKCIKVEFYYCVYSVVVINYYVTFEGGITYV